MVNIPHFSTLPPQLKTAINRAHYQGILCPPKDKIFHPFYTHNLNQTKVIIIGQEPYNEPDKANGLAFGYSRYYKGKVTGSLKNIIKEVTDSTGDFTSDTGLENWAKQGVLLLNTRLTTEINKVNAHKKLEWEQILKQFIKELDDKVRYKVYMLWGSEAQSLIPFIYSTDNLILTAAHPSPASAHKGFFGCDHFEEANMYLERRERGAIKW